MTTHNVSALGDSNARSTSAALALSALRAAETHEGVRAGRAHARRIGPRRLSPARGRARVHLPCRCPTSAARHSRCPGGGRMPTPPARALRGPARGPQRCVRPVHCRASQRAEQLSRPVPLDSPGTAARSRPPSAPEGPAPPRHAARPPARHGAPALFIGQAFRLRPFERLLLDEDPLALVTLTRPPEPHHDRRQPAGGLRSAGKRRIARREKREMVHVSALHAHRPAVLHDQQAAARAGTHRARPGLDRRARHRRATRTPPAARSTGSSPGAARAGSRRTGEPR